MNDVNGKLQYKDKVYPLVFNLNVMEKIQDEYGTLDEWGALTDGTVYAKKEYEKATESKKNATPWEDLEPEEQAKYSGEPNAKAVIFGFTEMINEGIDIQNDEQGTNEPFISKKQVGRIITEIGLVNATQTLNQTVVESTQSSEKNA